MSFTKLKLSALILAFGSMHSGIVQASQGTSEFVSNVDIDFPGQAIVLNVRNTSANKHVNSVNLAVQESNLDFEIDGYVECAQKNNVTFWGGWAYYGPVNISGGALNTAATLHNEKIDVVFKEKGSPVEATPPQTFNVPLNKLLNAHPTLKVNPVQEVQNKFQAHINGGGDAVDFYRQDQEVVLQRPLSLGAICGKDSNKTVGYETKNYTIQIKYKGDPAVNDKPVLNAQLSQANMPNQVNNALPFKLDNATFQPNLPHHFGKCLPDSNPKIRMNFQVSGSKTGVIDLRVKAVSNQYAAYGNYFETSGMVRDPKNGGSHLDFSFPLKEMLSQNQYSWMAISNNKTHNHNMQIEARYRNFDSNNWSQWIEFDHDIFKHRCVPQLNDNIGGNAVKPGFAPSAPSKNMTIQSIGPEPPVTPIGTIKAQPVEPQPPVSTMDTIKAQPVAPQPINNLKAVPVSPQPARANN